MRRFGHLMVSVVMISFFLIGMLFVSQAQAQVTILNETFEGAFPEGNSWQLIGSPSWNDTSYFKYQGSWSGYCAGSAGQTHGPYVANMDAWMIYGPFSLADAQSAQITLMQSYQCEENFDYVVPPTG